MVNKNNHPISLLLLSGASLVGRNILDMLADRRHEVHLIATNSETDSPTLYDFDTVYRTSTTLGDPDKFEKKILEIIEIENPDLIIPCRDDDVIFLADLKERRHDLEDRIVCGNLSAAHIMYDKFKSWEFSREVGLPFAPTVDTSIAKKVFKFALEQGFPLLAKPRTGFASRGIFIISNERQLSEIAKKKNYIIQKFLGDPEIVSTFLEKAENFGLPLHYTFEGIKHSIQIWIASEGTPVGWFCSKNVNRNGTSLSLEKYEGEDARKLAEHCLEVFSKAGWRGPVNIQCQKAPDDQLYIYEFNGRISGASAARYFMGFDEMNILTKNFLNCELSSQTHLNNRKVLRYLTDCTVPVKARIELENKGSWG